MPGDKLSGAQRRKRNREAKKEAEKASQLLSTFFKKAKSEVEQIQNRAQKESEKEAEEGGTQPESNVLRENGDVDVELDQAEKEEEQLEEIVQNVNVLSDVSRLSMETHTEADNNSESTQYIDSEEEDDNDNEERNKEINEFSKYITDTDTDTDVDVRQIIPTVLMFHDVGYLEFDNISKLSIVSQKLRTEMITRGPHIFQNKDVQFAVSGGRSMTQQWFNRRLTSGDEINRSWLLYSPVNESAYCFCCLLFTSSTSNCQSSFESANGFKNWRHTERIKDHENSSSHRKSFTTWKEAEKRLIHGKGIDAGIEVQIQSEKQRWRDVLKRVLTCIKFLASQNLALRGHEENLNDDNTLNVGNFLALLKVIAQYDPLLANHLQRAQENPRSVSYLSPEIQNEFICLLASTVRKKLLSDIKQNKYYGILLDSTPDLGDREQLSVVIRFVDVDFVTKKVEIKESFLGYIEIHAKDAATLEKVIVEQLESYNLPLADCRSQCYDNASVMSGHISGLQQRILARNHRALFINCDNHSLNLAGVHSAKQDPIVITFFGTIETIYTFFSRSTLRWEQLKNAVSITVKRDCETRWSSRSEAVKAMYEGLDELVKLLEKLSDDKSQTNDTRTDAENLLQNILTFNFLVLLYFWQYVLEKIKRVQKRLQDPTMNFKDAALDIESLENEFKKHRENLCRDAVETAKTKCAEWGIEVERRIRRRRRMPGELAQDSGLSAEEEIVRIMKSVLDRFQQETETRFIRLNDLNSKFGFLLDVQTLLKSEDLNDLRQNCLDFGNFYDTDVDGGELCMEICDCKMLLDVNRDTLPSSPLDLLSFIVSYGDDVFPNLRIALQILQTISVSIASCERSFSKLKLILSYLRASMGQDRLCSLALLSVERETLEKIDFDDVIDHFSAVKARKINLL